MSETSALSEAHSDDVQLEGALRAAVRKVYARGDLGNLTIKRVRASVERRLGLGEDFFKTDGIWKDRSKDVIRSEVDAHKDSDPSSNPQPQSPEPVRERQILGSPPTKPETKARVQAQQSKPSAKAKPNRKRKSTSDNEPLESEKEHDKAPKSSAKASQRKKRKSTSDDDPSEPGDGQDIPDGRQSNGKVHATESESELSVLNDEDPKPRKKKGQKDSSKSKESHNDPVDASAEEIKRLQGWLIKCGIRKMWHRELAPYDTPKSKIKHLKGMLEDAGMSGRYSKEKADQIREEREMRADLAAIQEGEKVWGSKNEEGSKDAVTDRPKRRLARGLQDLDFLNDDDGAETD